MKALVLLAGAMLLGCGGPLAAKAAPGFVEMHDESGYDFRAVAPEGVAVAARVVDIEASTDMKFWERAVALRMRELDGYALLETKDVKSPAGAPGRELAFGHDQDAKPYSYRVQLFVFAKKLLVVEAGGSKEQMERLRPRVDWMMGQVRVR